ncbi:unnamed protein product, partial [Heterosigma akashiwo]
MKADRMGRMAYRRQACDDLAQGLTELYENMEANPNDPRYENSKAADLATFWNWLSK